MKVDLFSFQDKAVKNMRVEMAYACDNYRKRGKTQVVSLQAPTASGKTIMAAALIEDIYFGMSLPDGDAYVEQPEAIFVWLSDSPELNEQSKQKIQFQTSKLRYGQFETISEESFDREMLEDGKIYFLNTQKVSKTGKLTKHSDSRQYTIWETLDNTIAAKGDHLYFIIDEAHRGAKSEREAGTDTTIMQRFIKGYEYTENGIKQTMRSMPVVLGISATPERFHTLISNIPNVSVNNVVVTPDEVRASGLLKDRIVITYPENKDKNSDMVLLEAAVDEWDKKCSRWYQYTTEQHAQNVDPVLVVQVSSGSNGEISNTDLDEVILKIEEKHGTKFSPGEVVHCFGDKGTIVINGLDVPHVNASDIAGDHKIKVVLFKEALSTGWDCPRAEAMMSFAVKDDPTYIAQLLGRMLRTPLQRRVARDEFLNDVKLYLPHFNKDNVKNVIDKLQSNEGSEIPTEINGESLEEPSYVTYTIHTKSKEQKIWKGQGVLIPGEGGTLTIGEEGKNNTDISGQSMLYDRGTSGYTLPNAVTVQAPKPQEPINADSAYDGVQTELEFDVDREKITNFINSQGYLTYLVRHERINNYLKSLLDLADLLTHNLIYQGARDEVINDVVGMIRSYITDLHNKGEYDALARQVLEFKLSIQVFDSFGNIIDVDHSGLSVLSETDLDRQLRNADAKLGGYGFQNRYYTKYKDDSYKIDTILFAADEHCLEKLGIYAKNKLNDFVNKYRIDIVNRSDECKKKYHDILADSDIISKQNFAIPENIVLQEDPSGVEYSNHLLVSEKTGKARIKMNGWEGELIETEAGRGDFVCWLRNPTKTWGLCIPYDQGGAKKGFYPDFLIVRKSKSLSTDYIVDILEPHGNQYTDNLPKAKALVRYAKEEERLGRIQLIHKTSTINGKKFIRLDMTDRNIQEKVLQANTDDELQNIFNVDGRKD